MSNTTPIQWCDSTVNPVMGCDGCPLYPAPAQILAEIGVKLEQRGSPPAETRELLKWAFRGRPLSALYHDRGQIAQLMGAALRVYDDPNPTEAALVVEKGLAGSLRCYAGVLHSRYAANDLKPEKQPKPGYARIFEEVATFPGRMSESAKWSDLRGLDREGEPWLNGFPRLIFVSDMGDALSKGITFDYLKQEIVDTVMSEKGRRHVWLWLTKRPRQMAKFSDWLQEQGIDWPPNLVPMTSVMNREMAAQVKHLKRIPAKVRGLSVEPLVESVDLDLEGIDWVIVGGESGSYARPFDLEWARALKAQCAQDNKAFFMKQLGASPQGAGVPLKLVDRHGGDWDEWPEDLKLRMIPSAFHSLGSPAEVIAKTSSEDLPAIPDLDEFERQHRVVLAGMEAFIETGLALEEIRSRELWKAGGYSSWDAYCKSVAGLSKVHANRLIRAASIGRLLGEVEPNGSTGQVPKPRAESQLRPLFRLDEEGAQRRAWEQAVYKAGGQPTAAQVAEVVAEILHTETIPATPPRETKRARLLQVVERLRTLAADKGSWDEVGRIAGELEGLL